MYIVYCHSYFVDASKLFVAVRRLDVELDEAFQVPFVDNDWSIHHWLTKDDQMMNDKQIE